jgi:hypothetical protein
MPATHEGRVHVLPRKAQQHFSNTCQTKVPPIP